MSRMRRAHRARDGGLLLIRIAVGATIAAHGAQKLFGWFGGHGIDGTAAMFHQGGFRPARHHAVAAGLVEAGSGTLLALGLATPAAGAAVAGNMTVASDLHRPNGFFATNGGFELPFVLGATGASLAVAGPGSLSFDRLLGDRLNRTWMAPVAIAGSLAMAAALIHRRQVQLTTDAAVSAVQGRAETTVTTTGASAPADQPTDQEMATPSK